MGLALSDTQAVSSETVLSARIRKRFGDAAQGEFQLDVDFRAPAGITILFGASGAGKTTILDCIAGLQTPDEGAISIGSEKVFDSAAAGVNAPARRRQVGYLFQTLALFPHMSVVAQHQIRSGDARCNGTEQSGGRDYGFIPHLCASSAAAR